MGLVHTIEITRGGSLQHILNAALGDLATATNVPLEAPTLQKLVAALKQLPGVASTLTVSYDASASDPAVQFAFTSAFVKPSAIA